jgi:hypothetical protein
MVTITLEAVGVPHSDDVPGTVYGEGVYEENGTATLMATPNPGWRFLMWVTDCYFREAESKAEDYIKSLENPYNCNLADGYIGFRPTQAHPVTMYAIFEKIEEPPEEPSEEPEDPELPNEPEPPETPRSLPPVVELREGFVPMRIPSVISGSCIYSHTALIELHEKRAKGDSRLFYAYELLGKHRGALRLTKAPAGGKLTICCDRVLELPKTATAQIDLPDNMLALLQAHLALALALRFNPSAVPALKERVAACGVWFARHQSAIDRDTFLDPMESLNRFGGGW